MNSCLYIVYISSTIAIHNIAIFLVIFSKPIKLSILILGSKYVPMLKTLQRNYDANFTCTEACVPGFFRTKRWHDELIPQEVLCLKHLENWKPRELTKKWMVELQHRDVQ